MTKKKYVVKKPNLIQKINGKAVKLKVGGVLEREPKDAESLVKRGILKLAVAPVKVEESEKTKK